MASALKFQQVAAGDVRLPKLVQLLEPELSLELIAQRLAEMDMQGSVCIGVFLDNRESADKLVGLGSYGLRTHCFSGRVMFVENVVFHPEFRGAGYGEALMQEFECIARAADCSMLTLDAYARNVRARNFYQRLGYDPRGVHFVKEL